MGMDENEQDYWGSVTQLDTAVGRVRNLLKVHGRSERTWVSLNADNGPEVSPASGQGTGGSFINPGRTGGLRGRSASSFHHQRHHLIFRLTRASLYVRCVVHM
jgi:arylsulfatase A-like enzyme